ncbi:hypothetical protein EDB89DRAFT_1907993 [Lactarius sanguifluus]|nr:hypothetical protein EDB89DRAFT_1907993 [Lactarius sanguifluus]
MPVAGWHWLPHRWGISFGTELWRKLEECWNRRNQTLASILDLKLMHQRNPGPSSSLCHCFAPRKPVGHHPYPSPHADPLRQQPAVCKSPPGTPLTVVHYYTHPTDQNLPRAPRHHPPGGPVQMVAAAVMTQPATLPAVDDDDNDGDGDAR